MSTIRRRDTRPEMAVRRDLPARRVRFRVDVAGPPGRPDLVLARWRAVIVVHGCFWHRHPGCRSATTPATDAGFWTAEFDRNIERDRIVRTVLQETGWRLGLAWECALRGERRITTLDQLDAWIRSGERQWSSDLASPPVPPRER